MSVPGSTLLDALDELLARSSDADELLRAVVRLLVAEPTIRWAGIFFLEDGQLVLGPEAGAPEESRRVRAPIAYRGELVGELAADGDGDVGALELVATRISAHVLLGWDTGGELWVP